MKPRTSYLFIILSAAFAFGLASIFHFAYDWLGENLFAGLFFPINESVFEHLKLTLYPLAISWGLFYRLIDLPEHLNKYQIFTGILISTLVCIYIVLSVYYILSGGFLVQSDIVNILSLLIGMLIGQYIACYLLMRCPVSKWTGIICSILLLIMGIAFAYFTLYPLPVPIMIPPESLPERL